MAPKHPDQEKQVPSKPKEDVREEEKQVPKEEKTGIKEKTQEGKGQEKKRKRRRGIDKKGESYKSLMNDIFERIADEAAKLSQYTHRSTLSSREIQDAVKLTLPGDLGRHAIAEGSKAISNFMSFDGKKSKVGKILNVTCVG
ncbi:histone h2b, putative [Ricinus communis]|uniref:Histone h2b, putative n=1 Tax=Ricinus communis TaxID=3988 RepID=B9SCM3_RICCO|nr:histone h2b, putative [Ricinus communis]